MIRNVALQWTRKPRSLIQAYVKSVLYHDDVIKWKHFPRYWPFVRGIHRSPVNSPHKGQWRGAYMISLICARINAWVNNCGAGDLRRIRPHYDVTLMHIIMDNRLIFLASSAEQLMHLPTDPRAMWVHENDVIWASRWQLFVQQLG